MEGPLLLLKAWGLSALMIWIYRRWFQRVAPPTPSFEAFCRQRPVIAAVYDARGCEQRALEALAQKLGRKPRAVATLGTFPWPHYRLSLQLERSAGAVLLRAVAGEVVRSRDEGLPALAHVLRDVLNELPEPARGWLHAGTFDNGLDVAPAGGWDVRRGHERRPRLERREESPRAARPSFGLGEPDPALLAARHGVNDAVPGVAR